MSPEFKIKKTILMSELEAMDAYPEGFEPDLESEEGIEKTWEFLTFCKKNEE
jgi:hypothetical protein